MKRLEQLGPVALVALLLTACGGGGGDGGTSTPAPAPTRVQKNTFDLNNKTHLRMAAAGALNYFFPGDFEGPERYRFIANFIDRPSNSNEACESGGTVKNAVSLISPALLTVGDKITTTTSACVFKDIDGTFQTESTGVATATLAALNGVPSFMSTSPWSATVNFVDEGPFTFNYEGYSFAAPSKTVEKISNSGLSTWKTLYSFDPKLATSTADDVLTMDFTYGITYSGTVDAKAATAKNDTKASCVWARADGKSKCSSVTATLSGNRPNFGVYEMTLRNVGDLTIDINTQPDGITDIRTQGKFEILADDQVIIVEFISTAGQYDSVKITGPSGVSETLRARYFQELRSAF